MPFVDPDDPEGKRIDPVPVELRQVGSGDFELLNTLVWVDRLGKTSPRYVVTPRAIGFTDLASVLALSV